MRRRLFFAQAAALVATGSRSLAQGRDGRRVIGFLSVLNPPSAEALARHPMTRALAERGFVEGRNLTVVWHFAGEHLDRLDDLAAALVRLPADVIVAQGGQAARAAAVATSDRPVVIVGAGDPLGVGLVSSLARPGGNVTGVSEASTDLSTKRVDLLRQLLPRAARIAVVWNANDQGMTLRYRAIVRAAETLHVAVDAYGLHAAADIDSTLATMAAGAPDAMLLVLDSMTERNRRRFLDFAAERRVPAMYELAELVREGGLVAYGPSAPEMLGRAAQYVARILEGARPADLPMEQATRFYLTLNLRTARALGIEVPPTFLALADEVIE